MEDSLKKILSTIDDAIANFQNAIPGIQKIVFDELQPLIKQFDIKDGKLLNNVKNLKLIGNLQNKLQKIIINADYQKSVNDFVESFNLISSLQQDYFKQFNQKFKPKNTLPIIKELAIEATINDLVGQGLSSNIIDPIKQLLNQNITTGGDYTQFQDLLRNHILSDDSGEGSLERYTKQITTDAINQYNAQYHDAIAQDLNFNWGSYVGSNIKTSREFCILLTKKQWVKREELPEILKGHIDGHDCKLSKTTGLPLGMIPDTNVDNFKVLRGGYNCGHQFFWVPDSSVPDFIINKIPQNLEAPNNTVFNEIIKDDFYKSEMHFADKGLQRYKENDLPDNWNLSAIEKYGLSETEAKLIFGYTGGVYNKLNRDLYNETKNKSSLLYESELNKALDKMPIYKGEVVRHYYAGEEESQPSAFELLLKYNDEIGQVLPFKGFASTSRDLNFHWDGELTYHIQSKTGRMIETMSSHQNEKEVLFKSNSMFRIISVKGKDVYLEELD